MADSIGHQVARDAGVGEAAAQVELFGRFVALRDGQPEGLDVLLPGPVLDFLDQPVADAVAAGGRVAQPSTSREPNAYGASARAASLSARQTGQSSGLST